MEGDDASHLQQDAFVIYRRGEEIMSNDLKGQGRFSGVLRYSAAELLKLLLIRVAGYN